MLRALSILLLMLLLTLLGAEGRASDAVQPQQKVAPAYLGPGEKLELYSYVILGVEVRSFTDEEFEAFYSKLEPWPAERRSYSRVEGRKASLFSKRKTGLLITSVVPGSHAEKSGLKPGDVIHSICCAPMEKPEDLLCVLRNSSAGVPQHMLLIDTEYRWKFASPRTSPRPEPEAVGYIIPRRICPRHMKEMRAHQAKAIELLAQHPVPIVEACNELEAICRILYKGYTPGSLRIPLRSGSCTLSATRNGWDIDIIMTEGGVVTKGSLRRWEITPNAENKGAQVRDGSRVLPESIRRRLQEMDTTEAAGAPVYPPNTGGAPIPGPCCR